MMVPDSISILPHLTDKAQWQKLRQVYEQVARVINGRLSFGSFVNGPENMEGVWKGGLTTGGASTDFFVQHNFGRPCNGYLVMTADKACSVYTSPTVNPSPNTQIILRCNTPSVNITLFLV